MIKPSPVYRDTLSYFPSEYEYSVLTLAEIRKTLSFCKSVLTHYNANSSLKNGINRTKINVLLPQQFISEANRTSLKEWPTKFCSTYCIQKL